VNWQHLKAFLWLRWRLRVNQFRKAGALNAVLLIFALVVVGTAAVGLFVTGFFVGLFAMPHASPVARLLVWDGVVVVFLFCWMIGLMAELQRAEGLAIDKFLHLPASPAGVFLVNYLSSLFSLTLIAFVPGMVGLVLGETLSDGPAVLLGLPLVAAFILMLTAVTYQFQGWLASLMANPRRRRTVIVLVTAGVILLAQLPNLINLVRPWEGFADNTKQYLDQQQELHQARAAGTITQEEFAKRLEQANRDYQARSDESSHRILDKVDRTARLISIVLPPGWLALGAAGLPDGHVLPALLAMLGLTLIGAWSLRRAYRTTVRLYTGEYATGARPAAAPAPKVPRDPAKVHLLERRLPWVSEHAAAVGLAAFRSLTRAPEAKMALLAPAIMVVVFGGLSASAAVTPPHSVRPFMAFAAAAFVLMISGIQLIGNQFGYDRAGFRAYVLSPAPRREILLGKNLSVAPLTIGLGTLGILLVGIIYPMRIDHYPAAVAQMLSAYLILCMLANAMSIFAPLPIAPGSFKATEVKAGPVMLQLLLLMAFPFALFPVVLPIGLEALVVEATDVHWLPVSLLLSLGVLAGVLFLYRRMLTVEGDWLAAREKKVLEVVTRKSE
jgi:ABC-2 type transport system permease protein